MDDILWLGQVFWLTFLACGVYLSLAYAHLADEERAKTVSPDNPLPPAAQTGPGNAGFIVSH